MHYQIVPLNVGNFAALPKQTCMYRMYREVTYEAPCIMWYIKGTENNIVVDLGPPDPDQCLENHGHVIKRDEKQAPINALKSIGVSPDDVKIIIVIEIGSDNTIRGPGSCKTGMNIKIAQAIIFHYRNTIVWRIVGNYEIQIVVIIYVGRANRHRIATRLIIHRF